MSVAIKICGLARPEDARHAAAAGATYGGVILAPGSRRTVAPERVPEIFSDSPLIRCGVFVDEAFARVVQLSTELRLGVVQLHGDESPREVERIASSGDWQVWKVLRPRTGEEFEREVERFGRTAAGILLDGWSEAARGGTGTAFPWQEVARVRDRVDPLVRLVVAGGLNARNVAEVVALLDPDVVDVSSGVESAPGVKDPDSIRSFVAAVSGAATSVRSR